MRGPKSTVPSSVILVGSVAAEWSYRVLGTLTPEFPVLGGGGGLRDRGLIPANTRRQNNVVYWLHFGHVQIRHSKDIHITFRISSVQNIQKTYIKTLSVCCINVSLKCYMYKV